MKRLKILAVLIGLLGIFSFKNIFAMEKYSSDLTENKVLEIQKIAPLKVGLTGVKKQYSQKLQSYIYTGEVCLFFDLRGVTRNIKDSEYDYDNDHKIYDYFYYDEYDRYEQLLKENRRNFFTEIPSAEEDYGYGIFFDESYEADEDESEENYRSKLEKLMEIKSKIKKIKECDISRCIPMLKEYLENKKGYCLRKYGFLSLQYDLLRDILQLLENFKIVFGVSNTYNFIFNKKIDGKFVLRIRNEGYEEDFEKQQAFRNFVETLNKCINKNFNLHEMFAFRAMTAFFYVVMDEYLNLIFMENENDEKDNDEYFKKILKKITKKNGDRRIRITNRLYNKLKKEQNKYIEKRYGPLVRKCVTKLKPDMFEDMEDESTKNKTKKCEFEKEYTPIDYFVYVKPYLKLYDGVKKNKKDIMLKAKFNGVKFNEEPGDFKLFYKSVFNEFLVLPRCGEYGDVLKFKNYKNSKIRCFEELFYPHNVKNVSLSDYGSKVIFEFSVEAARNFVFKLLDFDKYVNELNYFDVFGETFCYADRIGQIALLYRQLVEEENNHIKGNMLKEMEEALNEIE